MNKSKKCYNNIILESAVESRFWTQHFDSSSVLKNCFITNKVTSKFLKTLSKPICYARKSRSTADSRIMRNPAKPPQTASLPYLAKRYVWWETEQWALSHPIILLANIMNLGSWNDILLMRANISDEILKAVLKNAPPGYFSYRSWDFWHHILDVYPIPNLPKRKFL